MDQLTILADDKIGYLANILLVIAKHNINISGISTERGPLSEIRLIIDNPIKLQEILNENNIISHIIDVVAVKLEDNPGELAKIAEIFKENKVSIDYAYGFGKENDHGLVVMKVSIESDKARELLTDFDVK